MSFKEKNITVSLATSAVILGYFIIRVFQLVQDESFTSTKLNDKKFEELFWNLEMILLENNVAMEVIEKIKYDLKETLVDKPIPRSQVTSTIVSTLKTSIESLFDVDQILNGCCSDFTGGMR